MTDKPMTINGLVDATNLDNQIVISALKGLMWKGYVVKKDHFFVLTDQYGTEDSNIGSDVVLGSVMPTYSFDIPKGRDDK